jgi:hypothetical protein
LELAAQSATFESAIVHQFFDNQNRSTPINDFGRRRITLRAEWEPCQTLHLLLKTLGGVLSSTTFPEENRILRGQRRGTKLP